ncbi:MAG: hypothetical protein EOM67_15785, partial [Spirochaetia bacterium]|nr:hypothetical protein [Spirochaetia bacterium]
MKYEAFQKMTKTPFRRKLLNLSRTIKAYALRCWVSVLSFAAKIGLVIEHSVNDVKYQPDFKVTVCPDIKTDRMLFKVSRAGRTVTFTNEHWFSTKKGKRILTLLRREEVPGYEPHNYVTWRIMVPTRDGVRVPVTIVQRKNLLGKGAAPVLLFAYGAYGTNMPAYFDQSKLVLLERGFIFAMAHVRGGSELG